MRRKLEWTEGPRSWGWGCSECAWMFNPVGAPIGNSMDEMKDNFAKLLDKEFAAHVCAQHPGPKNKKA